MDWNVILSQLANVGEFLGGVVVVVSVAYVAVQVKQSSKQLDQTLQSLRTTTSQYLVEDFNAWRQMLLDEKVAGTWLKGLDDLDSLRATERLQFNMAASSYVWTTWYFRQLNEPEGLVEDLNRHVYLDMFLHPGYRQWYEGYAPTLPDDYREFLDKVLAHAKQLGSHHSGAVSNLLQGGSPQPQ